MNLDVAALTQRLSSSAKRLGDVTLTDLVAPHPNASNGLYVFLRGDDVAYAGGRRSDGHHELREGQRHDGGRECW